MGIIKSQTATIVILANPRIKLDFEHANATDPNSFSGLYQTSPILPLSMMAVRIESEKEKTCWGLRMCCGIQGLPTLNYIIYHGFIGFVSYVFTKLSYQTQLLNIQIEDHFNQPFIKLTVLLHGQQAVVTRAGSRQSGVEKILFSKRVPNGSVGKTSKKSRLGICQNYLSQYFGWNTNIILTIIQT